MSKSLTLFTDLYELTMAQTYYFKTENPKAIFELFFRELPKDRGYLISLGLKEICEFLENFHFEKEDLDYLREKGFKKEFLEFLKNLRFKGDLWATEEGELVFPNEPMIRIRTSIIEAQIFETFFLNTISFQSLIATKASRVVNSAKGKPVVDFGSRRAQGIDAGLKAAKASYIGGCIGTSNVLAGKIYQIPIFGTMAHSFVQAFKKEEEAFEAWLKMWGEDTILLVDTYDTISGTKKAIEVCRKLGMKNLKGIRLDSGDKLTLSKKIRKILDKAHFYSTKIFVSGNLNEYVIEEFLKKRAKMDAFGVGTSLVVSDDAPFLDSAYKLVGIERGGIFQSTMKIGEKEKMTLPGAKQVFRVEKRGRFLKDVIGLEEENLKGKKILKQIFKNGRLIYSFPSLSVVRERVKENLKKLPQKYQKINNPSKYPVEISKGLLELKKRTLKEISSC